jgi:hypothetical protein
LLAAKPNFEYCKSLRCLGKWCQLQLLPLGRPRSPRQCQSSPSRISEIKDEPAEWTGQNDNWKVEETSQRPHFIRLKLDSDFF